MASRSGALPEVTGDAATVVTPGDSEELAAVLRRLHDSPAERAALADRAVRRVGERFAWPAVAQATVAQYREAMQSREAPRSQEASRSQEAPRDRRRHRRSQEGPRSQEARGTAAC